MGGTAGGVLQQSGVAYCLAHRAARTPQRLEVMVYIVMYG